MEGFEPWAAEDGADHGPAPPKVNDPTLEIGKCSVECWDENTKLFAPIYFSAHVSLDPALEGTPIGDYLEKMAKDKRKKKVRLAI